jgi:sugar-specific transcriptional regulator TrmB/DNA-binding CsgD family transcriptional regulator
MSLADLGFTEEQERVYLALLSAPTSDLVSLARQTLLDEEGLRNVLDGLSEFGVVRITSAGLSVLDPIVGLGRLIERVEDELMARYRLVSGLRAEVGVLQAGFVRAPTVADEPEIERVAGVKAVRERIAELSFFARDYVCAIHPGGPQSLEALEASRPLDMRAIRRRLRMRLIHEAQLIDDEINRSYLRELVTLGVNVRLVEHASGRMLIFDGRAAVVPMDPLDSKRGALIVRHPALIAGLQDLFERVWESAQGLPPDAPGSHALAGENGPITDQDRRLLAMLSSGMTDETAAREIGVSVRHLRRRMSRLMAMMGARSRFEAGAEAARRGWL